MKPNTRQRIINTSIEIFANKGFGSTSIREIAKGAETTIPSIYYYFGSKEDLYSHVVRDVMGWFAASVAGGANDNSIREQLLNMGKAKHRFIAQNPGVMRLLLREWNGGESSFNMMEEMGPFLSSSISGMAEMVSRGIASGEFREIDPMLAARFLLGVFSNNDREIASLGRVPSNEETEAIVDLALEAIKKR